MWPKKKEEGRQGSNAAIVTTWMDPRVTGKCYTMSFIYRISKTKQNPAPELMCREAAEAGWGCSEMSRKRSRGANFHKHKN